MKFGHELNHLASIETWNAEFFKAYMAETFISTGPQHLENESRKHMGRNLRNLIIWVLNCLNHYKIYSPICFLLFLWKFPDASLALFDSLSCSRCGLQKASQLRNPKESLSNLSGRPHPPATWHKAWAHGDHVVQVKKVEANVMTSFPINDLTCSPQFCKPLL